MEEGLISGCDLPLIGRSGVVGVLAALKRSARAFPKDDVAFLEQVAGQVAIAIETALEMAPTDSSVLILGETGAGGPLFLDEVGDIPLELQAKLLCVLQEQEFERLGGNRTHKVDVRLIAATHRDLDAMVEQGRGA